MSRKEYKLPNGKVAVFEYDIFGIGKITLECMDELMGMIADRPQGDFVSRRYLLAEIDDLADEFSEVDENGLHSERWCGILDSKLIIVNAPSVSDRPQGEWISKHNGYWRCSECGLSFLFYAKGNYCPNCGARMKGADDE